MIRLRNQLNRRVAPRRGPTKVGLLSVDVATRDVRIGERRIELANKEFELLRALISDPRRVFTKEEESFL